MRVRLSIAIGIFCASALAHADDAASTLIVGGAKGLREHATTGELLRTLSRRAAQRPRYLPQRRAVVYLARDAPELWSLDLQSGKERRVARLPARFVVCKAMSDYEAGHSFAFADLAVQRDDDFIVDKTGRAACLTLQDRNANMMNVAIELRVELDSGAVRHAVRFPEGCPSPKPVRECERAAKPKTEPRAARFPFGVDGGKLVRRDAAGKKVGETPLGDDFSADGATSPSGRWVTVRGNTSEGDYIHNQLFLLDRQQGALYPIRAGAARPLPPAALRALGKIETYDAVGETAIRWLAARDLLIVDSLLVVPGVRALELGGDMAR